MSLQFFKYQGAGNDFIVINNQDYEIKKYSKKMISYLCNRHFGIGADGLIILHNDSNVDFYMQYFNSDGKESTMCGNGGRVIVRFASDIQIIQKKTLFRAIDGLHYANVFKKKIQLQMINVKEIKLINYDFFLNTGSPHYVKFVNHVKNYDVYKNGKKIRNLKFFSRGVNVNFVEIISNNTLFVRTYERGVEKETLSCGTGIVASVLAYAYSNSITINKIKVQSFGGDLFVKFKKKNNFFYNIWLEGSADCIFTGQIDI